MHFLHFFGGGGEEWFFFFFGGGVEREHKDTETPDVCIWNKFSVSFQLLNI